MAQMQQRFELVVTPTTQAKAKTLSKEITQTFGAEGWSLVAVTAVGDSALLLAFEQPMDE